MQADKLGTGFVAGLIPCPLTLFVMSYAMLHNILFVGIAFAGAMFFGVAFTLSVVAGATVLFREQTSRLLQNHGLAINNLSRGLAALLGNAIIFISLNELKFV